VNGAGLARLNSNLPIQRNIDFHESRKAKLCMTEKVTLYTSLPPEVSRSIAGAEVGAAYLAECVRSWRRAGFDVVSLNSAQEIERLVRQRYAVEYLQVSRDRPAIDDFLTAISGSQAAVAGILNADVLLMADPSLLAAARDCADGMTLFERINIDPDSLRPTGRSCFGFDAFIFATAPLLRIDRQEEFLFGQPWWDYWLPIAYLAAGGRLRTIKAPVLFHLQHQQNWRPEQHVTNARKFVRCLLSLKGGLPDDVRAEIRKFSDPGHMSDDELGGLAPWCFAKIRMMAEPIDIRRPAGALGLLGELVALLNNPLNRTLVGELDNAEARVLDMSGAFHQMSYSIWQQPIGSEDGLRDTADRAASILASRKATLLHFWALNTRWAIAKAHRLRHLLAVVLKSALGPARYAALKSIMRPNVKPNGG
jgi:hypothetical protein